MCSISAFEQIISNLIIVTVLEEAHKGQYTDKKNFTCLKRYDNPDHYLLWIYDTSNWIN